MLKPWKRCMCESVECMQFVMKMEQVSQMSNLLLHPAVTNGKYMLINPVEYD